MADERVRKERVENNLIRDCSPDELANRLELFPYARRDDRLKLLFGEWRKARFTGFTFLPYILYFIAGCHSSSSELLISLQVVFQRPLDSYQTNTHVCFSETGDGGNFIVILILQMEQNDRLVDLG